MTSTITRTLVGTARLLAVAALFSPLSVAVVMSSRQLLRLIPSLLLAFTDHKPCKTWGHVRAAACHSVGPLACGVVLGQGAVHSSQHKLRHEGRGCSRRQLTALADIVHQIKLDGVSSDVGQVHHSLDGKPFHVGQKGLGLQSAFRLSCLHFCTFI